VPQWKSARKVKDGLTTEDLYRFLTTDPNSLVKPIHEKAMSVLLLTVDSDDSPDGIPIKNRTRFRELAGRDSDLIPDSFST
jgi:hypothetical protein